MQPTAILATCWVCDAKPIAQSCPLCLGVLPEKGICGHCKGKRKFPLVCPACHGAGVALVPPRTQKERDEQGWRDPLICPSCCGDPAAVKNCNHCQNRRRIHVFYPEQDILDGLRACPCVDTDRADPRIGAIPDCPICRAQGVIPHHLWAALDAYARTHIGTPPPDLAYIRYRFLADHLCDIVRLVPAERAA